MIEHSAERTIARPPADVFAFLDDFSRTPSWLSRCVGIEQVSPGQHAVGTKLRYTYREGSREGAMDGQIAVREPDHTLRFDYTDKMVDVRVGFRIEPDAAGSRLRHDIAIMPKNFVMRLMQPIIRRALVKQTAGDLDRLKSVLEQGG